MKIHPILLTDPVYKLKATIRDFDQIRKISFCLYSIM